MDRVLQGAVYPFEDLGDNLSLLPLSARRALDLAGFRLSLEGFQGLPLPLRQELSLAGADDSVDAGDVERIVAHANPRAPRIRPVPEPDPLLVPEQLNRALGTKRAVSPSVWARLRALDRYALVHIMRRSIAHNDPARLEEAARTILADPKDKPSARPKARSERPRASVRPVAVDRDSRNEPDSSRFDRDSSRFDRDSSRFDRDSSRFDRDSSRFDRDLEGRPVAQEGSRSSRPPPWDVNTRGRDGQADFEMDEAILNRFRSPDDSPGPSPVSELPMPSTSSRVEERASAPVPVAEPAQRRVSYRDEGWETPSRAIHTEGVLPGSLRVSSLPNGSVRPPESSRPPPRSQPPAPLQVSTHINERGEVHMVDVGAKATTERRAVATGQVRMSAELALRILRGEGRKGEVLATARIAGIMAAKRTSELIPLCHPIALSKIEVFIDVETATGIITVRAIAEAVDRTGVEMEALTAVSVALLTIYDMEKSQERGMVIENIQLLEKSGGKSGDFRR